MRYITFLSLSILLTICVSCKAYVNPVGVYKIEENVVADGVIVGPFGQIVVERVGDHKITVDFQINKGAPSYNSGAFYDTMAYIKNKAIYKPVEYDSTCKITLIFSKKGITVKEQTDDYNFGCGFGHAVVADGFFKKQIILRTPAVSTGNPDK